MKIPRFTAHMKEILVKGGQLTDEHIHLTQQLLKKKFPHLDGLQSTLLSETDDFEALFMTIGRCCEEVLLLSEVLWVHAACCSATSK